MTRYKISFTSDQIKHTPACALDPRIPLRAVESLLKKKADEVYSDGRLRLGDSSIKITHYGFEVDREGKRVTELLSDIGKDWDVKTF